MRCAIVAATSGSTSGSHRSHATASRSPASRTRSPATASWPRMLSRRAVTAQRATSCACTRAHATSPASSIQSTARSSRSSRCAAVVESRDAATSADAASGRSRRWRANSSSRSASCASGPAAAATRCRSATASSSTRSAACRWSAASRAGPDVRLHGRGEQRRVEGRRRATRAPARRGRARRARRPRAPRARARRSRAAARAGRAARAAPAARAGRAARAAPAARAGRPLVAGRAPLVPAALSPRPPSSRGAIGSSSSPASAAASARRQPLPSTDGGFHQARPSRARTRRGSGRPRRSARVGRGAVPRGRRGRPARARRRGRAGRPCAPTGGGRRRRGGRSARARRPASSGASATRVSARRSSPASAAPGRAAHDRQDGLVDQPAQREHERVERLRVGPLGVVEHEHGRLRAQHVEHRSSPPPPARAAQQLVDHAERDVASRSARRSRAARARRRPPPRTARPGRSCPPPAGASISTTRGHAAARAASSACSSACRPAKGTAPTIPYAATPMRAPKSVGESLMRGFRSTGRYTCWFDRLARGQARTDQIASEESDGSEETGRRGVRGVRASAQRPRTGRGCRSPIWRPTPRATPLGIDDATPQLRWRLESTDRGVAQGSYRVVVATTAAKAAAGTGDVWDSGTVTSAAQTIDYAGPALASRTRYFWSVKAAGSDWAPATWFETAYLTPAEWKGTWISGPARTLAHAHQRRRRAPTTPAACRATRPSRSPPRPATGSCASNVHRRLRARQDGHARGRDRRARERRHRRRHHDHRRSRPPRATRTSRSPASPTSRRARRSRSARRR